MKGEKSMIKANFNAYNSYVTDSLYQWDKDQTLRVSGVNIAVAPEIHFTNIEMDRAIVRQGELKDGIISVKIPNSLLQSIQDIKVYIGVWEGSTFTTIETVVIPVIMRDKPEDYVLEVNDEEYYSFSRLENEIANMVTLAGFNAQVVKTEAEIKTKEEALKAQIANIIAHNNDTEGNTELLDIRTGADGTVYSSAGDAVRGQVSDLKRDLSDVTDNLFTFKDGTYEGVTVTRLKDGGLKLEGTCTKTVNAKQEIKPFSGQFTLSCSSATSLLGKLNIVLRDATGKSLSVLNDIDYHKYSIGDISTVSMIDLTFISGQTYNDIIYVQLTNKNYLEKFIPPVSAVDRVARNRLMDIKYVTPQDFGAIGDGVNDDSIAFQKAFQSGKDIFVPDGTYKITKTITIPPSFYKHKIYSSKDGVSTAKAIINTTAFPVFKNKGYGYTIKGLTFTSDDFPVVESGKTYVQYAYLYLLREDGVDDIDITVDECSFMNNRCMILARGRNIIIKNNLFWNMDNDGCAIYLYYPDVADGEEHENVNDFNNNLNGFRGIIIEGNRCHYTRNWLVNTTHKTCKNMRGLVIRNNYLEGSFCVKGYLNNALVVNNVSHQANHHDNTQERLDACFNLTEMKNTIIDNYILYGSDAYTTMGGKSIIEATIAYFLYCYGDFENNQISNVFVSNYMYGVIGIIGKCLFNKISVNVRKTMSCLETIYLHSNVKHNMFDVMVNDIRDTPDVDTTIIKINDKGNDDDNIFNVFTNYECIKY